MYHHPLLSNKANHHPLRHGNCTDKGYHFGQTLTLMRILCPALFLIFYSSKIPSLIHPPFSFQWQKIGAMSQKQQSSVLVFSTHTRSRLIRGRRMRNLEQKAFSKDLLGPIAWHGSNSKVPWELNRCATTSKPCISAFACEGIIT